MIVDSSIDDVEERRSSDRVLNTKEVTTSHSEPRWRVRLPSLDIGKTSAIDPYIIN